MGCRCADCWPCNFPSVQDQSKARFHSSVFTIVTDYWTDRQSCSLFTLELLHGPITSCSRNSCWKSRASNLARHIFNLVLGYFSASWINSSFHFGTSSSLANVVSVFPGLCKQAVRFNQSLSVFLFFLILIKTSQNRNMKRLIQRAEAIHLNVVSL